MARIHQVQFGDLKPIVSERNRIGVALDEQDRVVLRRKSEID
jgi:hypothetical protein